MFFDPFIFALLSSVALASFFPCSGIWAHYLATLTHVAISLLFFMHGAKLSRTALLSGLGHWRLHLIVLSSTFILFPILGLSLLTLTPHIIHPEIFLGIFYLCAMPSTIQSSIALTAIARGNVSAAVCSASASSLLGNFISPFLVGLLIHAQGGNLDTWISIKKVMLQMMLPFIVGHFLGPIIGSWIERHRTLVGKTDQSSILLIVYTAFSEAVNEGIWRLLGWVDFANIFFISTLLLSFVIFYNLWLARRWNFNRADEIAIVFCGSKKSLGVGIPMAHIIFPAASFGIMVLPLMIFHQIQLIVCAVMARRYRAKFEETPSTLSPPNSY